VYKISGIEDQERKQAGFKRINGYLTKSKLIFSKSIEMAMDLNLV